MVASVKILLTSNKIPFSKPTAAIVPKVSLVISSTLLPVLIASLSNSATASVLSLKLSLKIEDCTSNSSPKVPNSWVRSIWVSKESLISFWDWTICFCKITILPWVSANLLEFSEISYVLCLTASASSAVKPISLCSSATNLEASNIASTKNLAISATTFIIAKGPIALVITGPNDLNPACKPVKPTLWVFAVAWAALNAWAADVPRFLPTISSRPNCLILSAVNPLPVLNSSADSWPIFSFRLTALAFSITCFLEASAASWNGFENNFSPGMAWLNSEKAENHIVDLSNFEESSASLVYSLANTLALSLALAKFSACLFKLNAATPVFPDAALYNSSILTLRERTILSCFCCSLIASVVPLADLEAWSCKSANFFAELLIFVNSDLTSWVNLSVWDNCLFKSRTDKSISRMVSLTPCTFLKASLPKPLNSSAICYKY